MKAKLIIDNKEIEVEITEEELKKLQEKPKLTGYERVECEKNWYSQGYTGVPHRQLECNSSTDNSLYEAANYYSSVEIAENNGRADKLMRQLRRFAVEHREKKLDWTAADKEKYTIRYSYAANKFYSATELLGRDFGCIFFDSESAVYNAINTFHDELIWYFTKYRDSL